MTQVELAAQKELRECETQLEKVLWRLDRVGAGIAAIHVNAAIEQIKSNQLTVIEQAIEESDNELCDGFLFDKIMH